MAETVRVLVEEEEVDKRIRDLGEQISKDYEGKEVHLICVLKGGVFFTVTEQSQAVSLRSPKT